MRFLCSPEGTQSWLLLETRYWGWATGIIQPVMRQGTKK